MSGESSYVDVVGRGAGPGEEILPNVRVRNSVPVRDRPRGRARTRAYTAHDVTSVHERLTSNERPVRNAPPTHRPSPATARPRARPVRTEGGSAAGLQGCRLCRSVRVAWLSVEIVDVLFLNVLLACVLGVEKKTNFSIVSICGKGEH